MKKYKFILLIIVSLILGVVAYTKIDSYVANLEWHKMFASKELSAEINAPAKVSFSYNKVFINFEKISFHSNKYNLKVEDVNLEIDLWNSIISKEILFKGFYVDKLSFNSKYKSLELLKLLNNSFSSKSNLNFKANTVVTEFDDAYIQGSRLQHISGTKYYTLDDFVITHKNNKFSEIHLTELVLKNSIFDYDKGKYSYIFKLSSKLENSNFILDLSLDYNNFKLSSWHVNLSNKDNILMRDVKKLLNQPYIEKDTYSWAKRSLNSGFLSNLIISAKDRYDSTKVNFNYHNVNLKYSYDWPHIESLSGSFSYNAKEDKINLVSNGGSIYGHILKHPVTATIFDVSTRTSRIIVAGDIKASMNSGLKFIKNSPLKNDFEKFSLENTQFNGDFLLKLNLDIPLYGSEKNKVQGVLETKNVSIKHPGLFYPIKKINSKFVFSESHFKSDKFKGYYNNKPAYLSVEKIADSLRFNIDAHLSPAEELKGTMLENYFSNGTLKGDMPAKISIEYNLLDSSLNMNLASSLEGLIIDLPVINKPKNSQEFLTLDYKKSSNGAKLEANYNDIVTMNFLNDNNNFELEFAGKLISGRAIRKNNSFFINIDRLHLSDEEDLLDIVNLFSAKNNNFDKIIFYCDKLHLSTKVLERVELVWNNTDIPIIEKLEFGDKSYKAYLLGEVNNDNYVVNIDIDINDVGEMMSNLGNPRLALGGRGAISATLNTQLKNIFDFSSYKGDVNLLINDGEIVQLAPSNRNIRIVPANFNEINSNAKDVSDSILNTTGIRYKSIKASAYISNKMLHIDNVLLKGSAVHASLNGIVFLTNPFNTDLNLKIKSNIAGKIPLATTFASGNPALGAIFWLIDRAAGSKINKASQKSYKITGSWSDSK